MPFSFIEIEERKSRIIGFVFVFILLFYFLTAYLLLFVLINTLLSSPDKTGFVVPSLDQALIAFGIALFVALFHWMSSTSNLIEKISLSVGAVPAEPKDVYHQYFKNIVDEVSVAIGGRPIEARVIPTISMNAFALEDFNKRAVVGITEGLLSRLNRAQIEAVVGHEAGHIISGDCLATTVTCSLSEIYETSLERLSLLLRRSRGRGVVIIVLIYIVMGIMNFFSSLIRYFISRQREYRADAIAVRLTRDPLSMAEALAMISKGWRGAGSLGDKMQSIFIINPTASTLDETKGPLADVFSTHPPISERIRILLNMAHMDEKTLEEHLKNFHRVSPVAKAEFKQTDSGLSKKWSVFRDQKWEGPFLLEDLAKLTGLKPDAWVSREGEQAVMHAYEDKEVMSLFRKDEAQDSKGLCPHCRTDLSEISYEGVPILKCQHCEGVFVENNRISRIMIRRDKQFSESTIRLAQVLIKEQKNLKAGLKKVDMKNAWVLPCPACGSKFKMRRQFFVYSYPVEIDRCSRCGGIWFDKQELEVLQYIYENKEEFFDGENF